VDRPRDKEFLAVQIPPAGFYPELECALTLDRKHTWPRGISRAVLNANHFRIGHKRRHILAIDPPQSDRTRPDPAIPKETLRVCIAEQNAYKEHADMETFSRFASAGFPFLA
jgi:hypothetical protein